MGKIILYSAVSLDYNIADANGSVEWLEGIENPDGLDYGYYDFYGRIGYTLMGFNTYAQLKSWDIEFPYKEKVNYVFTHKQDVEPDTYVKFVVNNHIEFLKELKQQAESDIWLVGGAGLNTSILNAGLLDKLIIHIMPVLIGKGIPLFYGDIKRKLLKLDASKSYKTGVVELCYSM